MQEFFLEEKTFMPNKIKPYIMKNGINIDREEDNRLNAKTIREKLNLDNVVIHPTNSAFLSTKNGVFKVDGPYCEKPKITTGGGDHFNAGFITAKLLGLSEEACLIMAVATSGFYVRNAVSPSFDDLISFVEKY